MSGLVVSIVSHGHGAEVGHLLRDLAHVSSGVICRVVLTLNIPEPIPEQPSAGWPFDLQLLKNPRPLGFGANHNKALSDATEEHVAILNPDVRMLLDPFSELLRCVSIRNAGCSYPVQVDPQGLVQDSQRALLTPWALFRRRVLGCSEPTTDWVNAACLVIPTSVWRTLGGFDERYFMYCEDADLCLRIRQMGLDLVPAPVTIIHAGNRASHSNIKHLYWHVTSLIRFWQSEVYRRATHSGP